jgi:hypothetical protein
MVTKTQIQTPQKTPLKIKITPNAAYIVNSNGLEIPVSKSWIRQYIEYALATDSEIIIEVAP